MQEINILWFEDNFDQHFEKTVENLKAHCADHHRALGFSLYRSYPEDFQIQLFEGNYSLVFIDLNLDQGQKGSDVIKIIRENGAYIDILLYSNNPSQLIALTEGKNYVENISRHATYNGLEQKMKDLIDLVLYKEMMAEERSKGKNGSLNDNVA